jgi:hypothetical protein
MRGMSKSLTFYGGRIRTQYDMKLRPQMQLRVRDREQFEWVKEQAKKARKSKNEWVLGRIEANAVDMEVDNVGTEQQAEKQPGRDDVSVREEGMPESGAEGYEQQGVGDDTVPERAEGNSGSPQHYDLGGSDEKMAESLSRKLTRPGHDLRNCRVYGCLQCKMAEVKDEQRGLP